MGWETRNGRLFYYRKVRKGKRVYSYYLGRGPEAVLASEVCAENQRQRKALLMIQQEEETIDQQLHNAERVIRSVTHEHLEASGFHNHKGQWRKKRA